MKLAFAEHGVYGAGRLRRRASMEQGVYGEGRLFYLTMNLGVYTSKTLLNKKYAFIFSFIDL